MVKSNKFDYTGRTSSGPKLGKSIASDLVKRADKKQREALKSASMNRLAFKLPAAASRTPKKDRSKNNNDRRDNDKDARETTKQDVHKLDVKVPGKLLTDEGFALLADGMQKALETCHELALVDLNLTDNRLTTRSLARLAPIIHQSRHTLQTLDLSHNVFQVSTPEEAQEWETFLEAFRPCMTLRRLDLSNNPSLGSRAIEILARVYIREPPVEPLPATGFHSLITLPDDGSLKSNSPYLEGLDGSGIRDGNDPDLSPCANGKTLADAWILNYRCGLRSIPYLTLTNIGLDDTGALFLSFILEQHYYPIQLVTETNAAEATNSIRAYRQDANTKGIDWDHNTELLAKDGLHLLHCVEKLRMKTLLGDTDSIMSSSFLSSSQVDVQDTGARRMPGANMRRPSVRSVQSIDYIIYDKSDIISARKKIQRNTIVQSGSDSVELWHASLNAIIQSRKVFLLAPVFRMTAASTFAPVSDGMDSDDTGPESSVTNGSAGNDGHLSRSMSALSMNSMSSQENHSKRSYAATLMTTSPADSMEPELAITNVSDLAIAPSVHSGNKILRAGVGSRGHSSSSQEGSTEISDHVLKGPIERDDGSQGYSGYQRDRIEKLRTSHGGESNGYRDVSLRCQLPLPVCLQVLGHVMEPKEMAILGEDKQKKAFTWGQKKGTLRTEYEWRVKDESSQILMLLTSAECVEY